MLSQPWAMAVICSVQRQHQCAATCASQLLYPMHTGPAQCVVDVINLGCQA